MTSQPGSRVWFIPDGFNPATSSGLFPSHEAICVLNPGPTDAIINITLYFEDSPKRAGFQTLCSAERTQHIRMDRLRDPNGETVPVGVPYAMMVESTVAIVVQYSRMDTSQAEMALMTTMAYPL